MRNGRETVRPRSFSGCKTCRSRHAKCDEGQPACLTCQRLGLQCEGYEPHLFWITDNTLPGEGDASITALMRQSHRSSGFRYLMFSEVARRQMSAQLSESMGNHSALSLLLQLDSLTENHSEETPLTQNVTLGPFSVFDGRLFRPTKEPSPPANTHSESTGSLDTPPTIQCGDDEATPEELLPQDWTTNARGIDLDIFLDSLAPALNLPSWQNCNASDLTSLGGSGVSFLQPFHSEDPFSLEPSVFNAVDNDVLDYTHESVVPSLDRGKGNQAALDPSPQLSPWDLGSCNPPVIPEHAEQLLRFFRKRINKPFSKMQGQRKSPWQILFLPCALETFAELSVFGRASHTRSTILYAILATNAFQLHLSQTDNTSQPDWLEVGKKHRENAQHHLRQALQKEMLGQNQADYKESLMAMLSCAVITLYNSPRNFRFFLLDTERLIRSRGLGERKTFKVRLLHHMYTYLRVMAESMINCAEIKERGEGNFSSSSGSAVTLRGFRLTEESLTHGLDPDLEKENDTGYNDIHLEVQGQWNESLYPKVYGVPESLITILSQVISFANDKTKLEASARKDHNVATALACHTKTLEKTLWSWELPASPKTLALRQSMQLEEEKGEDFLGHSTTQSMVSAMHHAIIIYFYRRIYNLNAMMMQELVKKTLDYLQPCIQEDVDDPDFAASIAWPAFIASCEAIAPELQQQALQSIKYIEARALVFSPEPVSQVITTIWEQRSRTGDWTWSWPNVLPMAL